MSKRLLLKAIYLAVGASLALSAAGCDSAVKTGGKAIEFTLNVATFNFKLDKNGVVIGNPTGTEELDAAQSSSLTTVAMTAESNLIGGSIVCVNASTNQPVGSATVAIKAYPFAKRENVIKAVNGWDLERGTYKLEVKLPNGKIIDTHGRIVIQRHRWG